MRKYTHVTDECFLVVFYDADEVKESRWDAHCTLIGAIEGAEECCAHLIHEYGPHVRQPSIRCFPSGICLRLDEIQDMVNGFWTERLAEHKKSIEANRVWVREKL